MNLILVHYSHVKRASFAALTLLSMGCSSGGGGEDAESSDPDPMVGDGDAPAGSGGSPPASGDGDAEMGTGGSLDFEVGETAPGASLVLNEFMPSNGSIAMDTMGGAGDFIELFNVSDQAVDLGGYFISDKLDEPRRHPLPAGLVIEPGAFLLLWADNDLEEGPDHLSFKLAKEGEAVVLSAPSGEVIDSIDYVDATTDSSFARVPDGTGPWAFCTAPTPGAENDRSCAP